MQSHNGQIDPAVRMLSDFDMRDNGFDTIRLIAAILVILSHAFPLTGTAEPLEILSAGQVSLGTLSVSVFFLISGYLIPASLDRGSLRRYAQKRALRIIPALAFAVLVCAFVLGPIVTALSLSDFFTSRQTWLFLGNAAFLPVGYSLPGVFEGQPSVAVNGSLWSLKFGVACYVAVPVTFAFARRRVAGVVAIWLASFVLARLIPAELGGAFYFANLMSELFRFFGAGMLMYLLAHRIAMRRDWAIIAGLLCVAALFTPIFMEVMATAGAYAIVYFAYHAPNKFRTVTVGGDISYGVYVYAFPIQQLLIPTSMSFAIGGVTMPWLLNFALACPLAMLAGVISWVAIEKPFLQLGRKAPMQVSPA